MNAASLTIYRNAAYKKLSMWICMNTMLAKSLQTLQPKWWRKQWNELETKIQKGVWSCRRKQ